MNDLEARLIAALRDPKRDLEAPTGSEVLHRMRDAAEIGGSTPQPPRWQRHSWVPALAVFVGVVALIAGVTAVDSRLGSEGEINDPAGGRGTYTGLEPGTPAQAFADMLDEGAGGTLGPWEWQFADALEPNAGKVGSDPAAEETVPSLYALTCLIGGEDSPEADPNAMHGLVAPVPGSAAGVSATSLVGRYADLQETTQAVRSVTRAVTGCLLAAKPVIMTSSDGQARGFATEIHPEGLDGYTQLVLMARWQDRVVVLSLNAPTTVTNALDQQLLFDALAAYAREDINLREDKISHFTGSQR